MPVVFSIHLQDDGSPSHKKQYVRLPPPVASNPYLLRFVIRAGSTVAVKDCTLVTNYPKEGRETYQRLRFDCNDLADAVCEFQIKLPGVFEYHVEYTPLPVAHTSNRTSKHSNPVKSAKIGAVVVDPPLMVTNQAILDPATSDDVTTEPPQVLLPLDGISILAVIPKWMPQVTRWNDHFRAFAESGDNMVHLAPVNTRGASNSPYSFYDQLSISPDLFDKGVREPERERILKETLEFARKEFGILTVTDVVWNHTAHNSVWLQYHPEAGYNLKTAPHLRPAYELDEAILQLSEDLASYGIIEEAVKVYMTLVNDVNLEYYLVADNDLKTIQVNVCNHAKYLRVDSHGPRLGPRSIRRYIFHEIALNVITKDFHDDELSLANNGWIWNADPLVNFAGPESSAYLRREVIPWGDCVKLRYGEKLVTGAFMPPFI